MNRQRIDRRDHPSASAGVSRVLLLGVLTAGGLGLAAGIGWVVWQVLVR
jgi:hypothetical protein